MHRPAVCYIPYIQLYNIRLKQGNTFIIVITESFLQNSGHSLNM